MELRMSSATAIPERSGENLDQLRFVVIALIAFLTLVDLFATQAILPSLSNRFGVPPSRMGVAVNLSTLGMAVTGLCIAVFGRGIDRHTGIWMSLALLAIPTTALAFTDSLVQFSILRIAQGMCMASAFALTMAYLGEHFSSAGTATALAAYVTGNVASNVFGRMLSAYTADQFGIASNFLVFASLNLAGAALAFFVLTKTAAMMPAAAEKPGPRMRLGALLRNADLVRAFAIGFLILFVFIGTYTYVNFRLVSPALGVTPMGLGLVYLVFLPSLVTTPLAAQLARLAGPSRGIAWTLAAAIAGLMLCLGSNLVMVLAGLALIAAGTFAAQAIATGHVSRSAHSDARSAASGIYLSSYYAGGLAGSILIGQIYEHFGWGASVFAMSAALGLAIGAALQLNSATGNNS
jgi:MFS transporter, YNFM family, putative membrane transport protein